MLSYYCIIRDFLERQASTQNVYLFEFWKKQIENWKCKIKHSTIKNYNVTFNRLKEFTKDVNLNDVDLDFIERFDAYLKLKVGNTLAGANTRHKCLKAILRAAIAKNLLEKSPYANFKLVKTEGRRVYLTPDELRVIEAFKFPTKLKHLDKIRDMYLFSCYTGLRISDVTNLIWENIKGEIIEVKIIKTSKPLRTGIIDKSRAILDKYLNHDSVSIFPKISHQKINKGIKQMTFHLGIEKDLSGVVRLALPNF